MIVAICGLARSGKDTVANRIASYGYQHVKISHSLKIVCGILFDFPDMESNAKDEIDPRWGISPRTALQFFGTEVMQYKIQELLPNIGRTFWIQKLMDSVNIDKSGRGNSGIVISDLRFLHEKEYLQKYADETGLKLIVLRVKKNKNEDTVDIAVHSSESENRSFVCDYEILNNEGIEDLYVKVDAIFRGELLV